MVKSSVFSEALFLYEKKKEVEEYDKTHAKKSVKKDRGIAV